MIITSREKEIKAKAKEINDFSEQFQLIHATYATQEYIKNIVKDFYQQKLCELQNRISQKIEKELDTDKEFKEKKRLEETIKRNKFDISIGYINVSDSDIARVVKIGNSFTIYLASSLKDSIFSDNKEFNYDVIQKIRKLMAHELGHLVLHTKELLLEDGLQGSLNICNNDKEKEADIFGKELLKLRKERNKKIKDDGGAEKLFQNDLKFNIVYNWDILSIVYPFLFFTMFKVIVDSIAKDGENNTFSNIIELKTKKK